MPTIDTDTTYTLDEVDALTIALVVIDAFASLEIPQLPIATANGVVLLADALLQRARPHLAPPPKLEHIYAAMASISKTAAHVRRAIGAPPRV